MRTDLTKLIGEAHRQGLRARSYIAGTEKPTFTTRNGRVIEIVRSEIDHVFVIAVTYDPLDPFAPVLHQVAKLGIFEPGKLPWAVSIHDLHVICEMLEFPCELIHFLLRRSRLNELGRMQASDELDWFGHYLTEGLFFESYSAEQEIILQTYTSPFDDYYFYTEGQRITPAPKPRQPMPPLMRQLLTEMEQHHPPGYLTGALILLDMSRESRNQFARYVERQRRKSQVDGAEHDFTLPFTDARSGLTVFTTKRLTAEQLSARLKRYVDLKKYDFQADRWAGFGIQADRPGTFHVYYPQNTTWRQDENTARALEEFKKHLKSRGCQ